MNTALIVSIITSALQALPLTVQTVSGVKALLAKDPNIPEDLAKILTETGDDNLATIAAVQQWIADKPTA